MKEVLAGAAGFGLAIHFKIDVFENVRVGRERALVGELRAGFGLVLRGCADCFEVLFGDHAFLDEPPLIELDGVVLALVFLDLLLGPVAALVLRVGDGMAVVAVGVEFEDGRPGVIVRALDRLLDGGADLVKVFAIGLRPVDEEGFPALGEAGLDHRGTLEARAHRVFVVLDDVDDREIEKGRHVQRLVEAALVHRAIAEEAERSTLEPLVFNAIGEAETERRLAADDAVSAPVVLVRRKEMHRAALALRAPGCLPIKLGHAFIHAHSHGQRMRVAPVGGDDVVVIAHQRTGADGNGFLPDIEVHEAAHLALLVVTERALLESPDAQHLPQKPGFLVLGQFRVDGRGGGVFCFYGDIHSASAVRAG